MTRRGVAVGALMLAWLSGARGQRVDFGKQQIETVKIADGVFVLMGGAGAGQYSGVCWERRHLTGRYYVRPDARKNHGGAGEDQR